MKKGIENAIVAAAISAVVHEAATDLTHKVMARFGLTCPCTRWGSG